MKRLKHKTIIKIHVCAAHRTTPYVQKLNGEVQVPKAYSELGANRDFLLAYGRNQRKKAGYLLSAWRGGKPVVYRVFKAKSKSTSGRVLKAANHDLTALSPGQYNVVVQDPNGRVWRRQKIEIRPGRVARLYTDWALDIQGSSLFSDKGGSSFLLGGSVGLRHRFFGLRFGVWGSQRVFPFSESSIQLYSELRGEFGYRFEWPSVDLFFGGYGSVGMMLSHVGHSSQELGLATLLGTGGTASFCYWLTGGFGLSLQGSFGMAFFRRQELVLAPEGVLQLGLSFRL